MHERDVENVLASFEAQRESFVSHRGIVAGVLAELALTPPNVQATVSLTRRLNSRAVVDADGEKTED